MVSSLSRTALVGALALVVTFAAVGCSNRNHHHDDHYGWHGYGHGNGWHGSHASYGHTHTHGGHGHGGHGCGHGCGGH